jgi:hypothetical protein
MTVPRYLAVCLTCAADGQVVIPVMIGGRLQVFARPLRNLGNPVRREPPADAPMAVRALDFDEADHLHPECTAFALGKCATLDET